MASDISANDAGQAFVLGRSYGIQIIAVMRQANRPLGMDLVPVYAGRVKIGGRG